MNDKARKLVIGEQRGKFPGLTKERDFRIASVSPNHGVGIETVEKTDTEVHYSGKSMRVKLVHE